MPDAGEGAGPVMHSHLSKHTHLCRCECVDEIPFISDLNSVQFRTTSVHKGNERLSRFKYHTTRLH